MEPEVTTRSVAAEDFAWIIELIDRNRAENLTADERAAGGFVQGRWDMAALDRLRSGPGMFLAEVGGIRAGVALSTSPGAATTGPAGRLNALAADRFGATGYFMYGPVVVDASFRGHGVLRRLADRLLSHAASRYQTAVAFVEQSNTNSLAVHRHMGWDEFATFDLDLRRFSALAHRLTPAPPGTA